MTSTPPLELAERAAGAGLVDQQARVLLDELHYNVPFDGAWIALAEPGGTGYTSLASFDLDDKIVRYLSGPRMARDIEMTGAASERPPTSLSDLPYRSKDLQTWAECLLPAGFRETLSVALFENGGRHVGFMTILFESPEPPSQTLRQDLARLLPTITSAIDPVRSLAASAAFVGGARAGVVLFPAGNLSALPGLPGDKLLTAESALVAAARDTLGEGSRFASFLWPRGDRQDPIRYERVTVLGCEMRLGKVISGLVVLSPAPRLRGLTPRELEVLGHVIEGCSNAEIARALAITSRTVAAHVEHILVKLDATSRTLAAVRAERAGLYIPITRARRS
ncbi:response regulator transcription factor [Frondihabitans sp. PhB188]|uniref:response regulator transcription factor n=1 Tax=Frondihabitans sp. PhB188 TaxID=2485200 RepID=UPI001F258DA8|nr:LuxR C-terminal-related transcriptional regulator [Frondihabitans sp. PhB188]